jgi:hypothetical protein
MTAEVYSQTEKVIVWLGDGNGDSDSALRVGIKNVAQLASVRVPLQTQFTERKRPSTCCLPMNIINNPSKPSHHFSFLLNISHSSILVEFG